MLGLCALVKVINSQKRRVDVERVRELGKEVNLKIIELFPWAAISPSVYRILAHSWEVMELNGGHGLGDILVRKALRLTTSGFEICRSMDQGKSAQKTTFLTHLIICGIEAGQQLLRWKG